MNFLKIIDLYQVPTLQILEKFIYTRLYIIFLYLIILNDKRFGFKKYHLKSHVLNDSIDEIKQSVEKGDVLGIFIDLRKVFDTIYQQF